MPAENQAVTSQVPVLLLNGQYDEATPPKWAAQMKRNLPNSYHLTFKGWKHGVTTNWGNSCGMKVANAFFNSPNQKPELDCFREIEVVFE